MRKVLTRYEVDPAFLSVLFSFGQMPHLAESGSSNVASTVASDGSQSKSLPSSYNYTTYILTTRQKISYQVRYAEENHRSSDRPWSVRQTGVYHHHSAKNDFDLFILLHPT